MHEMDLSTTRSSPSRATASAARSAPRSPTSSRAGRSGSSTSRSSEEPDGDVVALELTELDPDVQASLESAGIEVGGLLNEDDLTSTADALEPDSSAALIVWENVWARRVTQTMRDAGGVLVAFERIPHEIVQAAREWALEQANA